MSEVKPRPKLVGHGFAMAWDYDGGNYFLVRFPLLTVSVRKVGWITQLIVSLVG